MKFRLLQIESFLAITEARINLADRGLVLIQGVNHSDTSTDSNGAGKSSIADALCWALYGVTARGESGDDIVNDLAGKNTRVIVTLEDSPYTYEITRYRKHKTGKNKLTIVQSDGLKTTELTKGTVPMTQVELLKIVGASYDVFKGAVYAGQEQMPDLPGMTDKALKMLIEEAAGVTVLEEAYKIARLDYNSANARLEAGERNLEDIARQLGWTRDQMVSTTSSITVWEANRTTSIQRQTEDIQALLRDIKTIDVSFDLPGAESRVSVIDAQIAGTTAENAEFSRLDREDTRAQGLVKSLDGEIVRAAGALTVAERELANAEHKVGCPCDECGRPLTLAELAAATAAAQKKVATHENAILEAGNRKDAALLSLRSAQETLDAFVGGMTDLTVVSAERAALLKEIAIHNDAGHRRTGMVNRGKQIKEQIDKEKVQINPHHAQLEQYELKEADLKKQAATQRLVVDGLMKDVDLEAANVVLYGPSGVRAHILDEVTPFLNGQTAKYLSTLSDGNIEATWTTLTANAKGELKEKFSIDVTNSKGGKKFGLASGGEKKKVRVATALALQDLVATRATKPLELFIGDEIDGALDAAGLERLTMVLEEKANDRGSVFIISHQELRDWIPNVLQVEKSATGETTITEMTV